MRQAGWCRRASQRSQFLLDAATSSIIALSIKIILRARMTKTRSMNANVGLNGMKKKPIDTHRYEVLSLMLRMVEFFRNSSRGRWYTTADISSRFQLKNRTARRYLKVIAPLVPLKIERCGDSGVHQRHTFWWANDSISRDESRGLDSNPARRLASPRP